MIYQLIYQLINTICIVVIVLQDFIDEQFQRAFSNLFNLVSFAYGSRLQRIQRNDVNLIDIQGVLDQGFQWQDVSDTPSTQS